MNVSSLLASEGILSLFCLVFITDFIRPEIFFDALPESVTEQQAGNQ